MEVFFIADFSVDLWITQILRNGYLERDRIAL